MCGEKDMAAAVKFMLWGSPPRVRGKDENDNALLGEVRITPACAGKSACRIRTRPTRRDHPRVCGEKDDFFGV